MKTQLIIIMKFETMPMRFELCRHCGEETIQADKCNTCLEAYKFVCPECNIVYEDYHTNCVDNRAVEKIIIE
jgi:hypothetical protein